MPIVRRDENGKFVPGTTGGPGRPKRANDLRQAMLEAVTEADILEVLARLLEAAKNGDPWAVKELLDRATGKPQSILDPDDDGNVRAIQIRYVVDPGPGHRDLIDTKAFDAD